MDGCMGLSGNAGTLPVGTEVTCSGLPCLVVVLVSSQWLLEVLRVISFPKCLQPEGQ